MKKDKYFKRLIFLIIFFVLVLFILKVCRYKAFISFEWQCEALRNNLIYNNSHGNLFHTFRPGKGTEHIELIEFLFWPIYLLFPSMLTLYFIQALFLGLTAIPIYLLAKEVINSKKVAFWLASAFLVWAPVYNLNFSYFTWVLIAPFFIVLNYYFFYKKYFLPFIFTMLLTSLIREEIALYFIVFAFFAFFKEHKLNKWNLIPFLVGTFWLYLSRKLILLTCQTDMLITRFRPVYDIRKILLDVMARINSNLHIFFKLFLPINFIGFISLELILILPSVALLLFDNENVALKLENIHHLTLAIPVIFIAIIFSFNKLLNTYPKETKEKFAKYFFFLTFLTLFFPNILGSFYGKNDTLLNKKYYNINNILNFNFFRSCASDQIKWNILKNIPDKETVACTGEFLPALSARKEIYEYPLDNPFITAKVNPSYYLIDISPSCFGAGHNNKDFYSRKTLISNINYLLNNNYYIVTKNDSCYLLKKHKN